MITIHKYTLGMADTQTVRMHEGARLLSVQVQHDVACLWALVDTDREKVSRKLEIRGTGHDCERLQLAAYVGTFQVDDGDLVFHLFDLGER